MKYTIISIDESRAEYKDKIREVMGSDEVFIDCLDARDMSLTELKDKLESNELYINRNWIHQPWKRGDLGGFYGHFNAWKKCVELDESLVVFEDDAIIPERSEPLKWISLANTEIDDIEFLSLCVNDYGKMFFKQRVVFDNNGYHQHHRDLLELEENQFRVSEHFAKVYQPWTLTAAMYTPKSAQYLLDTVKTKGMYMNADAFVMHMARLQKFNAYAPIPKLADSIVKFNEGHSLIQSEVW